MGKITADPVVAHAFWHHAIPSSEPCKSRLRQYACARCIRRWESLPGNVCSNHGLLSLDYATSELLDKPKPCDVFAC
jgi:hypothetical protein